MHLCVLVSAPPCLFLTLPASCQAGPPTLQCQAAIALCYSIHLEFPFNFLIWDSLLNYWNFLYIKHPQRKFLGGKKKKKEKKGEYIIALKVCYSLKGDSRFFKSADDKSQPSSRMRGKIHPLEIPKASFGHRTSLPQSAQHMLLPEPLHKYQDWGIKKHSNSSLKKYI